MTGNRTNEPTNEALRKALNVAREHFSAIAASGEIKVWEDTGEKRGIDYQAKVWAERGARLASEALAATRVPVQGEPNDDREALRDEFRSYLGDEIYVCSRDHSAWSHRTMGLDDFSLAAEDDEIVESLVQIASRATVPDAATGRFECDRNCVGMNEPIEDCSAHGRTPRDLWEQVEKVAAERDAALAAVERVRAVHQRKEADAVTGDCATESCEHEDKCPTQVFEVCIACWNLCEESDPYFGERGVGVVLWPCPTVAALDGAPEPGREAQLERAARELNSFGWTCHGGTHEPGDYDSCEDCQTVCIEVARAAFHAMSGTPHLSADQVWSIAKTEHDYAADTDNVPAFVMPLVDGLRAAGVPFDEQPFIDSGYLLPVEGESNANN